MTEKLSDWTGPQDHCDEEQARLDAVSKVMRLRAVNAELRFALCRIIDAFDGDFLSGMVFAIRDARAALAKAKEGR